VQYYRTESEFGRFNAAYRYYRAVNNQLRALAATRSSDLIM
jgi:hypothetical protein